MKPIILISTYRLQFCIDLIDPLQNLGVCIENFDWNLHQQSPCPTAPIGQWTSRNVKNIKTMTHITETHACKKHTKLSTSGPPRKHILYWQYERNKIKKLFLIFTYLLFSFCPGGRGKHFNLASVLGNKFVRFMMFRNTLQYAYNLKIYTTNVLHLHVTYVKSTSFLIKVWEILDILLNIRWSQGSPQGYSFRILMKICTVIKIVAKTTLEILWEAY